MSDSALSALLEAVRRDDGETACRLLFETPALANWRDASGRSVLILAMFQGRAALAESLADASPALDAWEAAMLGRLAPLEKALATDPTLAGRNGPDGFNPLHLAAFFGQPAAIRVLLAAGAPLAQFAAGPIGVAPLHAAAAGHSGRAAECVALLLAAGADPNMVQQGGFTPLHAAAQNGDDAMVRLLLEAGANPSATTDEGRTPLDFAREKGAAACVALLEAATG